MFEQSPAARSSKAPSEPPSEFSSWRDDASSSLAPSGTARDRTITVNTQRLRMGDHLKGKLQGMIRQRFENYLHIIQTLQNDIGKLAALTVELRTPTRPAGAAAASAAPSALSPVSGTARASIRCNEDGTFLVYTMLDAPGTLGSHCSSPSSCSSQVEADGEIDSEEPMVGASSQADLLPIQPQPLPLSSGYPADPLSVKPQPLPLSSGYPESGTGNDDNSELLAKWVQKVCEFGMSGRCHSLTALFHFGYTAWKQLWQAGAAQSAWMESVEDTSPGNIAEEDEKQQVLQVPGEEVHSVEAEVSAGASASSAVFDEGKLELRCPEKLLQNARLAAEAERLQQALDLCTEGLEVARSQPRDGPPRRTSFSKGGSSSSASRAPVAVTWSDRDDPDSSVGIVLELLSLRASVHVQLNLHPKVLTDAEELIALEPTCAEGYYWQSVALQGMGHDQEALEALMSALEYEPQNSLYQQVFTALFEEISSAPSERLPDRPPESGDRHTADAVGPRSAPGRSGVLPRRPRGTGPRDALSTTTQATHLSSRSTTPTEVSEVHSRSSSNDSLYVASAAFDEQT